MAIFTQEQGLAFVQYETDGATANFPLTFEYLEKEHVKVFVGVDEVTYTWLNDSEVTPTVTPSAGDIVTLRRYTPNAERLVDYQDGGQISEKLLDKDSTQLLYISQEAFDTTQFNLSSNPLLFVVDFKGNRGINAADPIDDTDVVNKRHIQGLQDSVDAAAQSAADSLVAAQDAQDAAEAIEGIALNAELIAQEAEDKVDLHLTDETAHDAAFIVNTPAGSIEATDVQSAINELDTEKQSLSEKGVADGYASLDSNGKVPAGQLPSFVDDVEEYADLASFPVTGESGKIYVAIDTSKAYRWSGSVYTEISPSEVNSVNGQTGTVVLDKTDVGLDQVDNTSDATKNAATANLTNKSLISPNRVDAKKDTLENLVTYADTTGVDGEITFATDVGSYFGIKDGVLVELGGSSSGNSLLVDGSFEQGVQGTCTNCTLAEETINVLITPKNQKSLAITITDADAEYELPLITDASLAGQPYSYQLMVKTAVSTVDVCEKINGVIRNCQEVPMDNKWKSITFYGQVGSTSTSIVVQGGAATSGEIYLDLVEAVLGKAPTAPSKSCFGELDCENTFNATVSETGVVVEKEGLDWINGNAVVSLTSLYTITFTTGVFTEPPSCQVTASKSGTLIIPRLQGDPTASTALVFTQNSSAAEASPFNITCTKAAPDFKPTSAQGVVITGQADGALLVVTNEGTTSNVTIGNATITVPFDTIKESRLISWDVGNEEATFLASGRYTLSANVSTVNLSGSARVKYTVEIDDGSGFSAVDYQISTFMSTGQRMTPNIEFVFNVNKGDKARLRVNSTDAGSVISESTVQNSSMTIRSVLDTQTVGAMIGTEFSTVPSASGLAASVQGGVEEQTADKWDGKIIYRRCYEVVSDITSSVTLHTIQSGLNPIEAFKTRATIDVFDIARVSFGGSEAATIGYNRTSGAVEVVIVGTSFDVYTGNRFCLKYFK